MPRSLSGPAIFSRRAPLPSRLLTNCRTLVLLLGMSFAATSLNAEVRVLRGFTLIDGTGAAAAPNTAMIIDAGRITWVGSVSRLKVPAGAEVVDLTGRFVMPGMIDLHGHLGITSGMTLDTKSYSRQTVERDLKTYAEYGVTTMLSLGLDKDSIFDLREQQRTTRPAMARVYTAGQGFVYRDGIGGGISFPGIPTAVFSTVSDVEPAVAEQARKHVDVIKFWTDDNLGKAKRMPFDICKAIIDSAHRHGIRVVAHIFYLEDAKRLADFGIDGLVHIVRDKPADQELIDSMKRHNTWQVASTLSREVSLFVYATTPDFISDPFFTRGVSADVIKTLSSPEYQQKTASDPNLEKYRQALSMGKKNLKALADGGVRYGMGTDTGVPGRFQGYFEHLELQEMVEAGLTPMQVIVAANKNGSEFLKATDLGTLRPGKWADYRASQESSRRHQEYPYDSVRLHSGQYSICQGTSQMTSTGNIPASNEQLNTPVVEIDGTTHDNQRYVNAMGPRGVIGIMTPGPNVNVENEMMDMKPEGVINAIDRYYVPNQKIGANADWEIIMKHVAENLDDSVRRLKETLMDHLILGMSSQSYMGGEKGSFALLDHLQHVSGVDVTMGAQSAEQAFKLCGAKRIALLTPYYPVIEHNAISYFTSRGFEVVHVEGLKCKSIIHVASQGYDALRDATLRCADAKPDAILQLGTNLHYCYVAADAERWLKIPVFASGTVIYWSALRKMGILDKIKGFGSLLEHH